MLLVRYLTHMDMVENVTEYSEMLQLHNWLLLPLTNNDNVTFKTAVTVRYHFGGSMELNTRILLLAYMVYL